jgi:formate/nitrite transporter
MSTFNAPANIAETVMLKVGVSKCKLNTWNVILLGILAGAFIAFGAEFATKIGAYIVNPGVASLVMGACFTVGLMLVVIAGAELFTGNNLMWMSVLAGQAKVSTMLYKWIIVFIANFLGSMLIVWFMFASGLVSGPVAEKAIAIATAKVGLAFWPAFFRGIMCNWLVCLAVWLAIASHDTVGKIFGIFFPIMAFVASGFEHSVANMYFIPIGMYIDTMGTITWGGFIHNMIPVTLGNIVGGAGFVGTIYWMVFRKCAVK